MTLRKQIIDIGVELIRGFWLKDDPDHAADVAECITDLLEYVKGLEKSDKAEDLQS